MTIAEARASRSGQLTGQRFGRLVVLGLLGMGKCAYWTCRCRCGQARVVRGYNLTSGKTRSCGCLRAERSRARIMAATHRRYGTPILRQVLLEQVGHRERTAAQIFAAFGAEWGTCCERRLWRALAWLIEQGKVLRLGTRGSSEGGYVINFGKEELR